MGLDLGSVTGALVLRDAWTGVIDKAMEGFTAMKNAAKEALPSVGEFAEANAVAFGGLGIAVAGVTAAFAGLAAVTVSLGQRGADILDVSGTLDHFSGSAEAAHANLKALRDGVRGTVDDMTLMQSASRLLSANVELNATQFKTLGDAAFVLQNRGLGTTADMMEVVSNALITGRTRALAMKLGVIDLGDAAENYAKSLGVEATMLSDAGKAEATRIQIMSMLSSAVADAGQQQIDFGESIDQMMVSFHNWLDSLSVAIVQSPVLTAALHGIQEGLASAFGDTQASLLENVVHFIEQGLIAATSFGLGVVETARVFYTAWSGIKTIVLGVTTAIVEVGVKVAELESTILGLAASLPGATQGMKEMAASSAANAENMRLSALGLREQTKEAALATIGQGEFNATLDRVGGTIFKVRDAMVAAAAKTKEHTTAAAENASAITGGAEAMDRAKASMLDLGKLRELEKKGLEEATKLWGEYRTLLMVHSTSGVGKAIADINEWKDNITAKMRAAHTDTKAFYDSLEALSHEKMRGVLVDWELFRSKSITALQENADRAKATYEEMLRNSHLFTRDALQEMLEKMREAQFRATAMGREMGNATLTAATGAQGAKASMEALADATRRATEEARRLKEASQTFSFDVTAQNIDQTLHDMGLQGLQGKIKELLRRGFSLQQAINAAQNPGLPLPNNPGPRMPGFAGGVQNFGGGMAIVGEHGAEPVLLPRGSSVLPHSAMSGMGVTNIFYVNGTAEDVANKISDILERRLMSGRLLGTA